MIRTRSKMLLAGAALCGASSAALAGGTDQSSDFEAMRAEMASLRAQVAELRQNENENWLNERRAEEVKGLVREVLNDADTRASFASDGMHAGIDDGGQIFLKSADGGFLMEVGGQIQFRYIWQSQDDTGDEDDSGFQVRRVKLDFSGHIGDPRLGYKVKLATNRSSGNTFLEDVYVDYDFDDFWTVKAGHYKLPFLRQELISSKRQIAVDRASVTEFFTLNRAEQVSVIFDNGEMIKAQLSFSDGANSGFTNIADTSEIALTGRADVTLMGNPKPGKDIAAWDGEDTYLGVGGAFHWELGDGNNGGVADYFGWTIDGLFETQGFSVLAAFMGGHPDFDAAGATDPDQFGFLVEGGYFVIPDTVQPFVRWEWLDSDPGEAQVVTIGGNYFLRKHNAKFTVDLAYAYENDENLTNNPFGANGASSGLGFQGSSFGAGQDDFFALRAQFQLLF